MGHTYLTARGGERSVAHAGGGQWRIRAASFLQDT